MWRPGPKYLSSGNRATASTQCQRCLEHGHWTYECSKPRVYKARPTRTQQLSRPITLVQPELPPELADKKGVADNILRRKEKERKQKKQRALSPSSSSSNSSNTSSESNSESESDSDSSSGSSSSSSSSSEGESNSDTSSSRSRSKARSQKRSQKRKRGQR